MSFPEELKQGIDSLCQSISIHHLSQARKDSTARYRQNKREQSYLKNDEERIAYLITRMPATYSAIASSLRSIQNLCEFSPKNLLDLGSGPGTAMWAACHSFPHLEKVVLIEKDNKLSHLGKQLAEFSKNEAIRSAEWIDRDLELLNFRNSSRLALYDLVILSYSLGEMDPLKIEQITAEAWQATKEILLIIEPGTPVGFERIRKVREELIKQQAHILAPCPHSLTCPMLTPDWCHFSSRIERTRLHKQLKEGTLGHEDEKFAYIAFSKSPCSDLHPRVLRHPSHRSGHIHLKLCTNNGIKDCIISKKMGSLYRENRKIEWGDNIRLLA